MFSFFCLTRIRQVDLDIGTTFNFKSNIFNNNLLLLLFVYLFKRKKNKKLLDPFLLYSILHFSLHKYIYIYISFSFSLSLPQSRFFTPPPNYVSFKKFKNKTYSARIVSRTRSCTIYLYKSNSTFNKRFYFSSPIEKEEDLKKRLYYFYLHPLNREIPSTCSRTRLARQVVDILA